MKPSIGLITLILTLLSSAAGAGVFVLKYENRIATVEQAIKDQANSLEYIRNRVDEINDKLEAK